MKRYIVIFMACAAIGAHAQSPWPGRWEGTLELAEGSMPFGLTIVEGGALLDLPGAELFGYPSTIVQASDEAIRLSFAFGAGAMTMSGTLASGRVDGAVQAGRRGRCAGGRVLDAEGRGPARSSCGVPVRRTRRGDDVRAACSCLPALRAARSKPPLVILHAGLGAADRDGNNYNMPGRIDSLRLLAEALGERGVATFRYDKRGAGVSSWLVPNEADLSIETWISDLDAAATALSGTGRWSGVWLLGLNDGAIVAAAAANELLAADLPVAGLVVACASADGPLDAFRKAVAGAPEEQRAAGEAIIAELLAGRPRRIPVGVLRRRVQARLPALPDRGVQARPGDRAGEAFGAYPDSPGRHGHAGDARRLRRARHGAAGRRHRRHTQDEPRAQGRLPGRRGEHGVVPRPGILQCRRASPTLWPSSSRRPDRRGRRSVTGRRSRRRRPATPRRGVCRAAETTAPSVFQMARSVTVAARSGHIEWAAAYRNTLHSGENTTAARSVPNSK